MQKRNLYFAKFSFTMNGKTKESTAIVSAYTKENAMAIIREYFDNSPKDYQVMRRATRDDFVGTERGIMHCSHIVTPVLPDTLKIYGL